MTTRKLRFAIFGNIYQPKKSVSIQKILACLAQHEAEAYIERNFYTFITEGQQLPLKDVNVFDNDQFEADFAISMGGDGTFLRTASVVGMKQIPILGINTGRLGFLADVNAQEIEHTINALHDEDYAVDTRAVIQVETNGQPLQGYNCALNDVAILKRDNASMIESRTQNYLVALDGRSEKLPDTTTLTLRRAPYRVQVIKRAGTKYFHTLREKMMWGADQRG